MERVARELSEVLRARLYPGLITPGAGFSAQQGIGTYEAFLRGAGLTPPRWALPAPGSGPARLAFETACDVMARTIVNRVERSDGLDLESARELRGPVTLHRVLDNRDSAPWGAWWFRDEVMRELIELSRKNGAQVLPPAEMRAALRLRIRSALAIRIDWNQATYLTTLRILSGSIPAVIGGGRPQPDATPTPTQRTAPRTLRGGYEQVWLPWTPRIPASKERL